MSEILCRWLNQELRLSKAVEPKTFAKDFSNGYLIGEVLHKYQLQNDFSMFMKNNTSISKLNNFTRIEPTLQLLGISFNINTAQDLMKEKQGVAMRVLYQLYVSLEKKKRVEISKSVLEIMQPAANAGLHKKDHDNYSDRQHQVVKHDAELKLQKMSHHYEARCQQLIDRSVIIQPIHQKRQLTQNEKSVKNIEKLRFGHQRHNGIMPFNKATIIQVPKPPSYTSKFCLKKRQQQQQSRQQQAQKVQTEIIQFETNRKKLLVTSGFASSSSCQSFPGDSSHISSSLDCEVPGSGTKLILQSNSRYIQQIRERLKENAAAQEQRAKRRDRFLVEQLKAHEAQEEAQREEQLVKRLTRQTQQEQRLAAQLLQIRMQKDVIFENRLFREQQYQQMRERDFREALEREAALTQQAKLERAEEIRKELEFFDRISAERYQNRYRKHVKICKDILEQIVDLATKVGEYRLFSGVVPEKQMREWKELYFRGLHLYEPQKGQESNTEFSTPLDPVEQEILNNQDYDDYINMLGEWVWPEEAGATKLPPTNNNIVGHIIVRLRNIVHPPVLEPSTPSFPPFTLKACVLGKFCSGKTTCLTKIAEAHGIYVLSADRLIKEALKAYHNGEKATEKQANNASDQLITTHTSLESDSDIQNSDRNIEVTETQANNASDQLITTHTSLESDSDIQNSDINIKVTETQANNASDQLITTHTSLESDSDIQNSNKNIKVTETQANNASDQLITTHTSLESDADIQKSDRNIEVTETQANNASDQLITTHTSLESDSDIQNRDKNIKLSTKAMQGAAAEEELRKGITISNELLLDIIVEAVKQVPAHSAWILDGFPTDITQAHLLEKALGGCINIKNDTENSRTNLAADPNPIKPPPPVPVLDLALLLDIPDESVVQRAYCHTDTNTPADATSPIDKNVYLGQILNRVTAFQDTWPKVEQWFGGEQKILVCVDASIDEEELYNRVEAILQQFKRSEDELDNIGAPDSSFSATPVHKPPVLMDEVRASTESNPDLMDEKDQSVMSDSISTTPCSKEPSRKLSICLASYDVKEVPKNLPETIYPPGSPNWVYMEEPLPPEVPEYLYSYWDKVCNSYVNNIKAVMQQLRSQCTLVEHQLFNIRERFSHYLERPNLMQELVTPWQKDFNSISEDMRDDEEMKAELHLRLDELRERLWDITEKRKEQDEQEKAVLMYDGWLEDNIDFLIKLHFRLMQVELDRLQETISILKIYYSSMYKQRLAEPPFVFVCMHLLTTPELKNESALPHFKHPDHSGETTKMKDHRQVKSPHEKLIFYYEEAVKIIHNLVSAEMLQQETNEQERAYKTNADARQNAHEEYAAALSHEENAAKVRIALVKGHGLVMVHSLQRRAEQTCSNIENCFEEQYHAEMNSINQLTEVVGQHIEAGAVLQNALVLEYTDFYLNGDCKMVASPVPSPCPPPLEKPTLSTPTITQLESLYQHLYSVAPSGLMSSSQFFSLFRDFISVSRGINTLPEHWINNNEPKLKKIVSMLRDHYDLIDWRQFLLSAALPWPFPSLTDLLLLLQHFKAADIDNTGFINEEQYLQTELWFSSVQSVDEDPSEPLPYDRLANLPKFFFQLFADHSLSSSRLDYVSMLQYFAAHPNPREGFVRALSVVLGQHLKLSSPDQLVISMPSIAVGAGLSSSEFDREYKEEETLCSSSSLLGGQEVSVPALLAVICFKADRMKDFPQVFQSQEEYTERLGDIYRELGYNPEDCVPFSVLSQDPFIQSLMDSSVYYKLVNIHTVLLTHQEEGEAKGCPKA